MTKTDNILIRINAELKEKFKKRCDKDGKSITDKITDYIKSQVNE